MTPPRWFAPLLRLALPGLLVFGLPGPGWGRTVYAKDYGYDPADATPALQAAINSGADRVVVSYLGTDWIVAPVFLASRQTLEFEPGVVVTAKTGAFTGVNDCLFSAKNQTDIVIEGHGAGWRMRKADYTGAGYTPSQWRHTLRFLSCSRVRVSDLFLRDSGGDGVFVGSDINQPPCTDVALVNLDCNNHYRQGISVTDAENLLISGCVLRNTNGTAPEAGIDFEPDYSHQRLVNCVIRDCRFADNAAAAALVYPVNLLASSAPISIAFENCYFTSAAGWGVQISPWPADRVAGTVTFANCLFEDIAGSGFYAQSKSAYRGLVRFEHCTWRRVAKASVNGLPRNPFCVTGEYPALAPEYGGVEFGACVLEETETRPALIAYESGASSGCANLSGVLYANRAAAAPLSLGSKAHDIGLAVRVAVPEEVRPRAILYPNPAQDRLSVEFANSTPGPVELTLYNAAGERALRRRETLYPGLARMTCEVDALPRGLYFYVLRRPGAVEKGKICLGK